MNSCSFANWPEEGSAIVISQKLHKEDVKKDPGAADLLSVRPENGNRNFHTRHYRPV
jgi:hypothetical protein